jgi:hypothetical protein
MEQRAAVLPSDAPHGRPAPRRGLAGGARHRAVTAEEIAGRAGMSLADFGWHTATRRSGLVCAYEEGARQLERTFSDGLQVAGAWRVRLHAAVDRTLAEFATAAAGALYMAEVPRTTTPSLRERYLEWRQRIATVLSGERGRERGKASRLHLEVVTGVAHHTVSAQMTGERCDLESVRSRIDYMSADYLAAPSYRRVRPTGP